jgi:hypothetical protein
MSAPATADAERLPEVARLLATVMRRKRPWLAELRWQYLENPLGPALWINATDEHGAIVAHYALLPLPPVDDPRFASLKTFLSLNVAVHPGITQPGLMIATTRALLQHAASLGPTLVLGVANANAVQGFTRLLRFESLGQLSLRFFPPWRFPHVHTERALRPDGEFLRWRVARPEADHFVRLDQGALVRRTRHQGLRLDVLLALGLPRETLTGLGLPAVPRAWWPFVPRLYAASGPDPERGLPIPERLRPSPLHYIFKVFAPGFDSAPLAEFLSRRRFEFVDFDVV